VYWALTYHGQKDTKIFDSRAADNAEPGVESETHDDDGKRSEDRRYRNGLPATRVVVECSSHDVDGALYVQG
jgi:hypothetical protein